MGDLAKHLDLDKTLSASKQIGDLFSPDIWREKEEGDDDPWERRKCREGHGEERWSEIFTREVSVKGVGVNAIVVVAGRKLWSQWFDLPAETSMREELSCP